MTGDLRPVLDAIDFNGCPVCGERPSMIQVHGPDEMVLDGCGHAIDADGETDDVHLEVARADLIDLESGDARLLYSLDYIEDMKRALPKNGEVMGRFMRLPRSWPRYVRR